MRAGYAGRASHSPLTEPLGNQGGNGGTHGRQPLRVPNAGRSELWPSSTLPATDGGDATDQVTRFSPGLDQVVGDRDMDRTALAATEEHEQRPRLAATERVGDGGDFVPVFERRLDPP